MKTCPSTVAFAAALFCSFLTTTKGAAAQNVDFANYIRTTWPDHARLPARKFLARAAQDSLLQTPVARRDAKRAWAQVVLGQRAIPLAQRYVSTAPASMDVSPLAATWPEREYNASVGFADDTAILTPAGTQFTGTISTASDVDAFRFKTVQDGTVTITMTGTGSTPLQRGDFGLFNAKGYLVYFGESSTTTPATLSLDLPAGDYSVVAEGVGTGGYRIDVQYVTKAMTTLPVNGTNSYTLTPGVTVLKVVLPSDGRFVLTMNGGPNIDSILLLLSGRMSYMFDVDDASTSANFDAGLNASLPAGTYYLIGTTYGNTGSVSFSTSFTAGALPLLTCNGSLSGSIPGGQEDFDTYRFVVASTQDTNVTVMPRGSANAIGDPTLSIFDRELSLIMLADDDYAFVGSFFGGTLPAGTYYCASTGYWDFGDYTIAAKCAAPAAVPAIFGSTTPGSIAAFDGYQTFVFDVGTPVGAEVQINEGTLPDAQLGLIDAATGLAWGFNDDAFYGNAGAEVSVALPKGKYHAVVREYSGDTGTYDLSMRTPMFRERTTTRLRGLGKNGDFAILIASAGTIPGLPIGSFGGFLEVDLTLGFVVGPVLIPQSGELDYGVVFPTNLGVALQSLHLNVTTLGGDFTNVLR